MASLQTCSECGGFVPARLARCPHCDTELQPPGSALARAAKACLKVATGGAVAMTLMACYGGPPHAYGGPPPPPPDPCQGNQSATDPNCAPGMASPPGAPPAQGQYAAPPPAAVIAR
jgi:hypothetical protein